MRRNANGANARPAATMRDAEGLVQIQVADISAELWWCAMSDKGIQIGAIDIDLSACLVDHLAQFGN